MDPRVDGSKGQWNEGLVEPVGSKFKGQGLLGPGVDKSKGSIDPRVDGARVNRSSG